MQSLKSAIVHPTIDRMFWRGLIRITAGLILAATLALQSALACISHSPKVEELFASADAVFIGKTDGSVREANQESVALVDVLNSWKGVDTSAVAIYADAHLACAFPLPEGKFLILAYLRNGRFYGSSSTAFPVSDLTAKDWGFISRQPELQLKIASPPAVSHYQWRVFLRRTESLWLGFVNQWHNPVWYSFILILWWWWSKFAIHYLQMKKLSTLTKAAWTVLIVFVPLLGAITFGLV